MFKSQLLTSGIKSLLHLKATAGLAVGTVCLSPLFIGESAPKTLRGTLVCCFQLCITLGIFLGYCTTYGTKTYTDSRQWRIPLGLCFVWAIMLVIGMVCMPESPRYLVVKNKIEEAKKSIGRSNKVSPEDPCCLHRSPIDSSRY